MYHLSKMRERRKAGRREQPCRYDGRAEFQLEPIFTICDVNRRCATVRHASGGEQIGLRAG